MINCGNKFCSYSIGKCVFVILSHITLSVVVSIFQYNEAVQQNVDTSVSIKLKVSLANEDPVQLKEVRHVPQQSAWQTYS